MEFIQHSNILIVDDTKSNIDLLTEALSEDHFLLVAECCNTALDIIQRCSLDLIILNVLMLEVNIFQIYHLLQNSFASCYIPVLFVTAKNDIENITKGCEIGAIDFITTPFNLLEVRTRVKTHLTLKNDKYYLKNQNELLEKMVNERTSQLVRTQSAVIISLASLAETRDHNTGKHIQRTQNFIFILARTLKENNHFTDFLSEPMIKLIHGSAPLHDIGKVGIPDKILLKPGKLTDEESLIMQKHTTLGHDVIQKAISQLGGHSILNIASDIAWTHHERWDGSGYPRGLKGEEIPLPGRLMSIVDVYDALISERVYKDSLSHDESVRIMEQGKGTLFDPLILEIFLENHKKFKEAAIRMSDNK